MLVLENGATPISFCYNVKDNLGVVLAEWSSEFVVWTFCLTDGKGQTTGGHYYQDEIKAWEQFHALIRIYF